MTDIKPGDIVTCPRATGAQLWVVVRAAHDDWFHCRAKRVDQFGHYDFSSRIIGGGDLELVHAAPAYSPGQSVEYESRSYEVAAVHDDTVELISQHDISRPLRGGSALRLAAGNVTIDKASLTLELLR